MNTDTPQRLTLRPVWIAELSRGFEGKSWSLNLNYEDADGVVKNAVLPFHALVRPDVLNELSVDGLVIMPNAMKELVRYLALQIDDPDMPRVRSVPNLGFFNHQRQGLPDAWVFMMPNRCYQPQLENQTHAPTLTEQVSFRPERESRVHEAYVPSGTLEEWQSLTRPLEGNPMLVFALCVAMAGPFQNLAGLDNAIFHFYGDSSTGKTTALQVAVTVWGCGLDPQSSGGRPTLVERWNATQNAMEPLAAAHSGILLVIDELGSSGDLDISVYNVTSGQGKARMQKVGGLRSADHWQLLILSAGEFSMQEKIESTAKRKAKTGEIIRAMDIPVGSLPSNLAITKEEERVLIEHVKASCGTTYGTAGPALIQKILDHFQEEPRLRAHLAEMISALHAELIVAAEERGHKLGPAHKRALKRLAFVGAVGILAVQTEVLPFTEDTISSTMHSISEAWLSALPPLTEGERAVASIRSYLLRFTSQVLDYDAWSRAGFPDSARPNQIKSIRKGGKFLFNADQLKDACNGASPRAALLYLKEQGMLHCEENKLTTRIDIARLEIKRQSFHVIDATKLMSGVQTEEGDDVIQEDHDVIPDDAESEDVMHERRPIGGSVPRGPSRSAMLLLSGPKSAQFTRSPAGLRVADNRPRRILPGEKDSFTEFLENQPVPE